jgi:hypothetical protein
MGGLFSNINGSYNRIRVDVPKATLHAFSVGTVTRVLL